MPDLTIAEAHDRGLLRQASLLQFRGSRKSLVASWIMGTGRGKYSHSAMLVFCGQDPFVAEVREFVGGRIVTLESQVERNDGKIDVYHPPTTERNAGKWSGMADEVAARRMMRFAGCDYGYAAVALAYLYYVPCLRARLAPPINDDEAWDGLPPYCSHAVSLSFRASDRDPVPNLADRYTAPNDLTRSGFFEYACTLITE